MTMKNKVKTFLSDSEDDHFFNEKVESLFINALLCRKRNALTRILHKEGLFFETMNRKEAVDYIMELTAASELPEAYFSLLFFTSLKAFPSNTGFLIRICSNDPDGMSGILNSFAIVPAYKDSKIFSLRFEDRPLQPLFVGKWRELVN